MSVIDDLESATISILKYLATNQTVINVVQGCLKKAWILALGFLVKVWKFILPLLPLLIPVILVFLVIVIIAVADDD